MEGLYPKQDGVVTSSNRKISNENNLRCPFLQRSDESSALATAPVAHWRHPQQLRQRARMDQDDETLWYGVSEQSYLDNLIQDKRVEGFAPRGGRTWPIQLS